MDIKNPILPCICCYATLWTLISAKQAINDKLQGSVAICLERGEVIDNQIKTCLLLTLWVKKIKIGEYKRQSYKQERDCLVHFARRANTLLKDEESARDNDVLACNFAKYLPI